VPLCTPQDLVTFGGHDEWKDETAWNYEVGSKSTIMGGRGTFNASIFYMDISDLQATLTAGTCSSRVIFNVPKARSQGVELEFTANPTPAFDFAFSGSYDDSELRSTVRDSTGAVVGGIQAGNRLPTVPKLQVSAAATWQHPMMTDWLGYLTGVYQHVGSRFTQTEDQGIGFGTFHLRQGIGGPLTQSDFTFDPELPAYDIVNVRYGMVHDKLEIAVFVNNVTDEQPKLSLDRERGRTARLGYVVGEPRMFGVTTRLHF
jgi:iron complex outermembrane receptor protein